MGQGGAGGRQPTVERLAIDPEDAGGAGPAEPLAIDQHHGDPLLGRELGQGVDHRVAARAGFVPATAVLAAALPRLRLAPQLVDAGVVHGAVQPDPGVVVRVGAHDVAPRLQVGAAQHPACRLGVHHQRVRQPPQSLVVALDERGEGIPVALLRSADQA
ncbi:MAG TPA: hypothetical protein VIL48_22775 [Acidimicrobiales bacterium]